MKKILVIGCILLFMLPLVFLSKKKDATEEMLTSPAACEILIQVNGTSIPLETYLVGVVAGEMPASFHLEALKAQAIAARTYALRQTAFGETAIQATTAHQVYETKQQRQEKWKTVFSQYESKIEQAVVETTGLVAVSNGELITAMFHASSADQTESAANYSGQVVSYLQSVPSTETLEEIEQRYSLQEMNEKLAAQFTPSDYHTMRLVLNDSGRVDAVTINQRSWSGREFRELVQIKSTHFIVDVEAGSDEITIRSKGYGHGVGMSQYGANEMAERGKLAEDIITHYYRGVQIEPHACN